MKYADHISFVYIFQQRIKNRLYTCWTGPTGMDCKLVGPETPCFCKHRYNAYPRKLHTIYKRSQLPTSPSQISWNQHKTGIYFVKFRPHTNYLEYFRYKQHKTDFEVIPTDRPILLPCKQKGCKCVSYNYVPMNGSQPIRCTCKHTSEEHFEFDPFICKRSKA